MASNEETQALLRKAVAKHNQTAENFRKKSHGIQLI